MEAGFGFLDRPDCCDRDRPWPAPFHFVSAVVREFIPNNKSNKVSLVRPSDFLPFCPPTKIHNTANLPSYQSVSLEQKFIKKLRTLFIFYKIDMNYVGII